MIVRPRVNLIALEHCGGVTLVFFSASSVTKFFVFHYYHLLFEQFNEFQAG